MLPQPDRSTLTEQVRLDDPTNPRLDVNFVERHPRLATIATDARLRVAAERLLGPGSEYVNSDGSIYCCETEWHYDTPGEHQERRHAKFALYLDALDRETGAPRVLPVSHHDPGLYRGPLEPYLGFDGAIEARTGLPGEMLPGWSLITNPGDVLVWDFRTMHCSYGSTDARRQFALNFRAGPA